MNFLRPGQWEDNQDEFISWCFCNQDTVISNYVHVFDYCAGFWSEQRHPWVHGWLGEWSLHHLLYTQIPLLWGKSSTSNIYLSTFFIPLMLCLVDKSDTWAIETEFLYPKTFTYTQCKNTLSKTKYLSCMNIACIVCWHYLVLLSWSSTCQNDQPPSPVLHVVQEVWLVWLNQERFQMGFCCINYPHLWSGSAVTVNAQHLLVSGKGNLHKHSGKMTDFALKVVWEQTQLMYNFSLLTLHVFLHAQILFQFPWCWNSDRKLCCSAETPELCKTGRHLLPILHPCRHTTLI